MMIKMNEKKTSIKDFHVDPKYIGKGGLGTVYRATHNQTGIEYAIKKIDKKLLSRNENLLKRIHAEVKVHYQLKHPSICELFDVFEDESSIYLLMRLCENGDFMTYVKKMGRLREIDIRFYMKQIVSGLLYLHKHDIMHRDLTLSNLLLTKEGNLMIADFGLTQINEYHYTTIGNTASLGVMMYTMLGNFPFGQNSGPIEMLEKVRVDKCFMPHNLSYYGQDLLDKLLNKDPLQRLSLMQVYQHPFLINEYHPHVDAHIDSGIHLSSSSSSSSGSSSLTLCDSYTPRMPPIQPSYTNGIHLSSSSSSSFTFGSYTPRMPPIQSSYTNLSSSSSPSLIKVNSSIKMNGTAINVKPTQDRVTPVAIGFNEAKISLTDLRSYFELSPVWSEEMRAIFDGLNRKLVDNKSELKQTRIDSYFQ